MPNQSKINDQRFWTRWRMSGAVAIVILDEATRRRIIAEQVVEIPQCGLYVKTPHALAVLLQQLEADGYEIKDYRSGDEPKPKHYRYMSLRDDVCERKGKCGSCNSYIDVRGIRSHKHKCEVCGAYTYIELQDGSTVRFYWIERNERPNAFEPSMRMKVFDYDDELKCLLLYPDPEDGNNFNDWGIDNARKSLEKNKDKYTFVEREGQQYIAIPYDVYSHMLTSESVINMADSHGHTWNHKIVKLYKGKEYSEWEKLPVADSYNISDAWPWAPLKPSPDLHERIISAAGMVSRADYYYQDGRPAFYETQLQRMRLFVEHFTTLNLQEWDQMIWRADRSGPGMIKAIARFCHPKAVVRNEPNIGNLLVGMTKMFSGERVSEGEAEAFANAWQDDKTRENFFGVLGVGKAKQ